MAWDPKYTDFTTERLNIHEFVEQIRPYAELGIRFVSEPT